MTTSLVVAEATTNDSVSLPASTAAPTAPVRDGRLSTLTTTSTSTSTTLAASAPPSPSLELVAIKGKPLGNSSLSIETGGQTGSFTPQAANAVHSEAPQSEHTQSISEKQGSINGPSPSQRTALPVSTSTPALPIEYHYLTFDTLLPPPSTIASSTGDVSAPKPPNLSQHGSPFDWPSSRKSLTLWLLCAVTVLSAYAAGAYSPAVAQMSREWGVSEIAVLVGTTAFCVGFAVAPMALAPFSEINGRRPVFIASGVIFVLSQLGCAVTQSYAGMIVARFFVGVGGSTFSTMVGGVVSDIYHAEHRNTPMSIFAGAAFFGTGLGPLVSGFVAQHLSWRWVFWLQTIVSAILVLAVTVFLKESRGSVVLSNRAKLLNKWYEAREEAGYVGVNMAASDGSGKVVSRRIRWKVKSDEERESLGKMIGISVYRPFHLLLTEPVVFFFSLWAAFSWAVLYLQFGSIPLVFRTNHAFNTQQSGAVFAAISIGSILATLTSILQEKVLRRLGKAVATPETRLYCSCFQSILMPVGLFWFGWTCAPDIPWIVPTLAIGCATMGIYSIYLAVFNYMADTYHRYASSALAAQSFCRNISGGIFPLITNVLFRRLTFAGASSLLGGVGALLTLVPWVLVFYGPRIRARSKFASEIMTTN